MLTQLSGKNLKKVFNRRVIFKEVAFALHPGQSLLITGPNGSGKSTLVKIISGVLTPTEGEVEAVWNGSRTLRDLLPLIGLVSPYLQMYEEFSARENLEFALAARGLRSLSGGVVRLLEEFQLGGRIDDPVRTFSSGMKQRVKYAFALVHRPPILILDEPMSNLDTRGMDLVASIMAEQLKEGILVVATNDVDDLKTCDCRVDLGRRE